MTNEDLRQILGRVMERLAALERKQEQERNARIGDLYGEHGLLTRMTRIESRVDALEQWAIRAQERFAQVPGSRTPTVGDGSLPVPDDSSEL